MFFFVAFIVVVVVIVSGDMFKFLFQNVNMFVYFVLVLNNSLKFDYTYQKDERQKRPD